MLTDDERIRALNRDYREVDRPTDVLSFALADPSERDDPSHASFLGEIYVSVETARVQASKARRPVEGELAHLLIHGLLHLLGHDHGTRGERLRMSALESRLLRALRPEIEALARRVGQGRHAGLGRRPGRRAGSGRRAGPGRRVRSAGPR